MSGTMIQEERIRADRYERSDRGSTERVQRLRSLSEKRGINPGRHQPSRSFAAIRF